MSHHTPICGFQGLWLKGLGFGFAALCAGLKACSGRHPGDVGGISIKLLVLSLFGLGTLGIGGVVPSTS